jgi:small subunit ribosomal protein S20
LANHKSAAKRARQTIRRTEINSNRKSAVRTSEKKLKAAIESNDAPKAQECLKEYSSELDRAARRGLFHKRHVSRKVARASERIATLG